MINFVEDYSINISEKLLSKYLQYIAINDHFHFSHYKSIVTVATSVISVWDMILQWGSTIKVSIELPVATRHRRDMTEKLLKATLNPNTYTHQSYMWNLVRGNGCRGDVVWKCWRTDDGCLGIIRAYILLKLDRYHFLKPRIRNHNQIN